MPANGIRVTIFLALQDFTFSETHWHQRKTTIDRETIEAVVTLCSRRDRMCGDGCGVMGARVSVGNDFRNAMFLPRQVPPVADQPANALQLGPMREVTAVESGNSDAAHTAILALAYGPSKKNSAKFYVAGIPDAVTRLTTDRVNVDYLTNDWTAKWTSYCGELYANWGFKSRVYPAASGAGGGVGTQVKIIAATQDAATNKALTIHTQGPIGGFSQDLPIQLRGFRTFIRETPRWQGYWHCTSHAASTVPGATDAYTLQASNMLDVSQIKTWGYACAVDWTVIPYASIEARTTTHRKRGGRTFLSLGRQSAHR